MLALATTSAVLAVTAGTVPSSAAAPATAAVPQPTAGVAPTIVRTPLLLTAAGPLRSADRADGVPSTVTAASTASGTPAQPFDAIGFTYRAGVTTPDVEVSVRENGQWSAWEHLDAVDGGPDADTAEAARAAAAGSASVTTEPLLVAGADAYRVRVVPESGAPVPADFTAVTIDAGTASSDALAATTAATTDAPTRTTTGTTNPDVRLAANAPAIISRAAWGADESLRLNQQCDAAYNSTIKVGFVHHVASTNNYDAAGTAAEVRSIYAYQVLVNGWCDVGYNFLVDKYGRVYEGRWGGVDRAVKGSHTGGFNTDSFGVAAIGNYETALPTDALVESIGRLMGWKLGLHNRNPLGQDTLVGAGGGTSKYPAGQRVTFNVVSGHRDAGNTLCPGEYLYPKLPAIRATAHRVALQTDTTLTGAWPAYQEVAYGGPPAPFTALFPAAQAWEFSAVEASTGTTVRRMSGYAEPGPLPGSWDLRDDSLQPVRGGLYTWYLRTAAGGRPPDGSRSLPPPEAAAAAPFTAGVTSAGFVPVAPARVYDSRAGRTQPLGPGASRSIVVTGGTVPADARGIALNVTAVDATQPSHLSAWPTGAPARRRRRSTSGRATPSPGWWWCRSAAAAG